MYPDVVDLREFYESPCGTLARRLLREKLRALWPQTAHMAILGFGYATPLLRPFMDDAVRVLAFMPAQQGITWWPREGPNATSLTEETQWPLPDGAVDRIVLAHTLENSEQISAVLQEAHRVLAPHGKMMVLVPNRSGWWAHESATPFGFGFSFSLPHIKRMLVHNHFQLERHARALFLPPFAHGMFGRHADVIEKYGNRFLPALAGVLFIEVGKQTYARPARAAVRVARPAFMPALPPLVSPTTTRNT